VKTQKQSGSAHVIIVVVVVVAVISLLGFVFWQKLSAKTKADTNKSTTITNPVASNTPDVKTYKATDNSYTFNYPSDWTVGDSTCRVSCNNTQAFTLRAPDYKPTAEGPVGGAIVYVSPNAQSGSLQEVRKNDESFVKGSSYTYNFNFSDTTVAGLQAYKYQVNDQDNTKNNDETNIVFLDKKGSVWRIAGSGASVTTSSQYDGVKALELVRSSWKWL
jgi:hypothetical protein